MLSQEYEKDKDGNSYIPATQRPDGTWRKPIKVKDGYVPQDEMPVYESKGRIWAKNLPDYPIGLAPDDIDKMRMVKKAAAIPGLPATEKQGLSKSQKKKMARKKKNEAEEIVCAFEELSIDNERKENNSGENNAENTDLNKKLRNLKKKLREIEKLEKQISSGEISKPDPDQVAKVKRKTLILDEISHIEQQLK